MASPEEIGRKTTALPCIQHGLLTKISRVFYVGMPLDIFFARASGHR